MENQTVRVNLRGIINARVSDLNPFQDDIKILTDENYEAMKAEILADGFSFSPHVFADGDGKLWLLDGHQRRTCLEKMQKEGYSIPTIPCMEVEADDLEHARRLVLAAASQYGTFKAAKVVDFSKKLGIDSAQAIERFVLPMVKFEKLISVAGYQRGEGEETDFTPPKDPITKHGDLIILGKHRLLCGDSTKKEDIEKLMSGHKADLWLTDPPYGVAYKSAGHDEILNDALPLDEMAVFWEAAAKNALDACSDEAAYYWFACQGGDQMMMMMSIGRANWKVRHELIWVKDRLVLSRCDYHYRHEPILYGWKKDGTHKWYSDRSQTSVLEFPRPHKSEDHPTMKPLDLIEYLIGNSSKDGHSILDTFGGSGTTLIAAEKMNRRCFMMELSPAYCDVIVSRYEKFSGQKAIRP